MNEAAIGSETDGQRDVPDRDRFQIIDNLARVRADIADACLAAGRAVADVHLVGVTKYVDVSAAVLVAGAGLHDLAESRPQSLWQKAEAFERLGLAVRWHLIGHLQRNKVRRTLSSVHLIHSLDSLRLLTSIDAEGQSAGVVTDVLFEVNLTGRPARTGFRLDDLPAACEAAQDAAGVRLRGLMAMASPQSGESSTESSPRAEFSRLRKAAESLRRTHRVAEHLTELSMGMSGDFREAILEGSTIVRIGSALWEGVQGR